MTEDDTGKRKAKASKARLELELTEAAFDAMRANAIGTLVATKDGETALREMLYRAVKVIDAVRKHLFDQTQDGLVADFIEQANAELKTPGTTD